MADVVKERISVDDIDGTFVPTQVPGALEIEVAAELVVVGGPFNQSYVLNPTAALVWQCFDGEGTLDELVADLSAGTGVDPDVIRADVLALIRELAGVGLLDGVALREGEVDRMVFAAPKPLEVGDPIERFTLPDMEGSDTALDDLLGDRLLLVNWSPWCGFCVRIAEELAGLRDGLAERGIGMAFVTSGEADDNRGVFADAGLEATTLLKLEDVDPFAGFGTPAAYLLDAEGNVAAPMAYGADQVPALARELAGLDVVQGAHDHEDGHDHGSHAHVDGDTGIRYLSSASTVCGPAGPEAPAKSTTEWLGTRAYAVEGYHVGVRYNSEYTAGVLDRLLPGMEVEDPEVPENYAVALFPPAGGGARELNLLVRGGGQLVRSRSAARALWALLAHMSADLIPPDPSLMYLDATPAVRNGEGLLLPPHIVGWVKELQPRLGRLGIQLADVPWASLDAATGELVVPEPAIGADLSVLDDVDHGVRLGSELPPVRPGRYPLRDWFLMVTEDQAGPLSLARAVAASVSLIAGQENVQEVAGELIGVLQGVEARGIWFDGPTDLADQLARVG